MPDWLNHIGAAITMALPFVVLAYELLIKPALRRRAEASEPKHGVDQQGNAWQVVRGDRRVERHTISTDYFANGTVRWEPMDEPSKRYKAEMDLWLDMHEAGLIAPAQLSRRLARAGRIPQSYLSEAKVGQAARLGQCDYCRTISEGKYRCDNCGAPREE